MKQPTAVVITNVSCSTLLVKWTGNAGQEYLVKATTQNALGNTPESITATNISCDSKNNCTATIPVVADRKYTVSVESKSIVDKCAFYSYAVRRVMDYPVAACKEAGTLNFGGKVFLQGAYIAAAGKMSNALNAGGILQAYAVTQPYNNKEFAYSGTEAVGPGFFAAHPSIVDWVLLELRDPNVPSGIVARRAAFVTEDGSLVDTDGSTGQISFKAVVGIYYVTVRHRNHLSVRSSEPVDFRSGAGSVDFTTASFRSFKNQPYPSTVQVGTVWCMRGGNAIAGSPVVKYTGPGNSQNQILNRKLGGSLAMILGQVYAPEDVNMDGSIRWNGPGNDQNFLLNKVLSGSLSTQLAEQQ